MLQDRPGFNEDGTPVQLTKRKQVALVADKVIVQGVLGNTVGRVGRVAGRLLLGRIPDTAKEGSFQEEKSLDAAALPTFRGTARSRFQKSGVRWHETPHDPR